MPGFKDYLAADLNTFLNQDEFAEPHNIDGVEMPVITDSDILKERPQKPNVDGVYTGEITVFVRSTDLPDRPVKGQHLRLDEGLYMVLQCTESNGMLEITLEANEA